MDKVRRSFSPFTQAGITAGQCTCTSRSERQSAQSGRLSSSRRCISRTAFQTASTPPRRTRRRANVMPVMKMIGSSGAVANISCWPRRRWLGAMRRHLLWACSFLRVERRRVLSLLTRREQKHTVSFPSGGSLVRAILAVLLVCLIAGCISAAREREAHCLAATMTDLWQTEQELTSAEQVWRTAQYAPAERSATSRDSSPFPIRVADASSPSGQPAAGLQGVPFLSSRSEGDTTFYRDLVDARLRHREASKWYGVVARRVQTRIEEDEML